MNKVFKRRFISLFLIVMMIFLISPKFSSVYAENESVAADLFISEYIEGSSNNKAIEIYNGTDTEVDLSNYSLKLYFNGKTTFTAINLTGSIKPGDVFIVSNSSANDAIKAQADLKSGSLSFNGDDAVELVNGTKTIDIMGKIGDTTKFGEDKTLIRKSIICLGNTIYDPNEWNSIAKDVITSLGTHTMDSFPITSIKNAKLKSADTIVNVIGTVTFKDSYNSYIQDNTSAIDIYKTGLNLSVGQLVVVKGKLAEYNDLLEIVPSAAEDIHVLRTVNTLPVLKTVRISELTYDDVYSRVNFENVSLGEIITTGNTLVTDSEGKTINIYKIPDLSSTGIKAGDKVDITAVVQLYKGNYQLKINSASDIAASSLDTIPPVITHIPVTNGSTAEDFAISALITDDCGVLQANLYYRTKGASSYKTIAMTKTENNYIAVIPKAELDPVGLEYYIEAKDSANTATYPADVTSPCQAAISLMDITGPAVTSVTPAPGDATGDNKKPAISASFSDLSGIDVSSIKLYLDGTDVTSSSTIAASKIDYTPAADLKDGSHSLKLEVKDNSANKNLTTKEWSFTVGKILYNTYFGMIHSHTNYSDGQGTPEEAYAMARANADFFAVTDHSNSLDGEKDAALLNEDGTEKDCMGISTEWKSLHDIADKYNEDGKFTAIAGYEMTWSGSTGGYGHINTFNTTGFETRTHSTENLKKYYEDISKLPNSISQLNHPGATFGDFDDFNYRTDAIDNAVNLIEVGNGEGKVRSSGYFPSYNYYTRALDKGWHVAPTNNQDNHMG
ncbi:MAG: lamin tail domain-containing protein, partial [Clostridiaceae bacterium]